MISCGMTPTFRSVWLKIGPWVRFWLLLYSPMRFPWPWFYWHYFPGRMLWVGLWPFSMRIPS